MIISDYWLWAAPLAFYLLDNALLLEEDELLLTETFFLKFSYRLSEVPFVIRGKHLYFLNPFIPHARAFKLTWFDLSNNWNPTALATDLSYLTGCRFRLRCFRVVGVCSFSTLFILGPVLTAAFGLFHAILIVLPIHICLVFIASTLIFQITTRTQSLLDVCLLALEFIICPGYLANIARRQSLKIGDIQADGAKLALVTIQDNDKRRFTSIVNTRISEA